MSSRTRLKNIVSFNAIPAGESQSLPHGLNIKGAGVVPDFMECGESNVEIDVTADETNVIVTNKGGVEGSVAVLVEHWHSIPRQLRQDDLPIQPFKGGAQGAGSATTSYIYRPGATDSFALPDNVYTDWESLYEALQSTKDAGQRDLEFDSRFSTDINAELGQPVCLIPAGEWDMQNVIWKNYLNGSSAGSGFYFTYVEFADDASVRNLAMIAGPAIWIIGNNKNGNSIILEDGRILSVWGYRCIFTNTDVDAKPMFAIDGEFSQGTILWETGFAGGMGGFPDIPESINKAPLIEIDIGQLLITGLAQSFFLNSTVIDGPGGGGLWGFFPEGGNGQFYYDATLDQPDFTGTILVANEHAQRMQLAGFSGVVYTEDADARYSHLHKIDTTAQVVVMTLPPAGPRLGETVKFKDIVGNAGTNKITVAAQAGETIDGAASVDITNDYGALELNNDGFEWFITARV